MFYLVPFILALLIGTLRSRQPKVLMLWELRTVFLLPIAFFFGLLPFWLATYWPDVIWTNDRHLLMILQTSSRGLLLLFCLINLVPALKRVDWAGIGVTLRQYSLRELLHNESMRLSHFFNPNTIKARLKMLGAELWHDIKHIDLKLAHIFSVHPRRILAPEEQPTFPLKANRLRLWGLILTILALSGQIMVLLSNQGYWPLASSYLNWVKDPLYVQGIHNGALRLQQLINGNTHWPILGHVIPWPNFTPNAPAPVRYISPTEPILAISLFLLTLSLFPARNPKSKRGK